MAATKGSCACGKIALEFTGEPQVVALCHCLDCQKWTGSAFTPNLIIPRKALKLVKGTPKAWDATGASGKINKHLFCGDCGSGLWSELEVMPDSLCLKAGCLDGGAASMGGKIGVEFYTKDRVTYLAGIEGAKQVEAFGGVAGGS
ncbi:hypothetical protein CDD81_6830 [Ophiocordyceps australis]|uniref:CENP-V/GFA domain-containing protein n=1 Tax=Ophiocordyceps australis TaxID=1399860 RepID=A0A2C5Y6V1_9HYPO|nr:hypothetical protein CDD81_6830 [Ophiocordyceps australis]